MSRAYRRLMLEVAWQPLPQPPARQSVNGSQTKGALEQNRSAIHPAGARADLAENYRSAC